MSANLDNAPLAFGLTLAAGLATTVGSAFAFCSSLTNTRFLAGALSLSAGVMLYVSFVEIYAKSVSAFGDFYEGRDQSLPASFFTTWFFFLGVFISALLDFLVHRLDDKHHQNPDNAQVDKNNLPIEQLPSFGEREMEIELPEQKANADPVAEEPPQESEPERNKRLLRMALIAGLAIALHNFPEGLATFVATLAEPRLGVGVAIAIALHNIPEGLVVSVPVFFATGNRYRAFLWSFLSGLTEPIGALLGWLVLKDALNDFVFGVVFGIVSGMMVFISLRELLPTAHRYDPHDRLVTKTLIIGMVIMAISLELFKL
jgi:ZIP family zinc transporter